MTLTAADARCSAQKLEQQARGHKLAVRHHRRELRACMEELSRLRAACERLGIRLDAPGVEASLNQKGVEETHGQGKARAFDQQRG